MCCIENIIIPFEINGRAIHQLVYFAQGLQSGIYMSAHGRTVNCKSIIGVISLGLHQSDSIQISVLNDDGENASKDIQQMLYYIRNYGDDV